MSSSRVQVGRATRARVVTGLLATALLAGQVVLAGSAVSAESPSVVATIKVGPSPTDMALDPDKGTLYVLDDAENQVDVVSTATNTVIGTIDVPAGTLYLTLDTARRQLFVASSDDTLGPGAITVIDTESNTVKGTTQLVGSPRMPVLDSQSGILFVAQTDEDNGPGAVSMIDVRTNTVRSTIKVGISPADPALDAVRHRLYVPTSMPDLIDVIDTQSNKVIAHVKAGRAVDLLVLDAPHRRLFAVRMNGITVINTKTNKPTAVIKMPVAVDNGPPALDTARQRLYVPTASQRGYIVVVDTRTNKVKSRIQVGYFPNGPLLDAARQLLYVAEFDEGDGSTVAVLDTRTNRVGETITVGKGPTIPLLAEGSGRVYVPNRVSGTVSVLDVPATR